MGPVCVQTDHDAMSYDANYADRSSSSLGSFGAVNQTMRDLENRRLVMCGESLNDDVSDSNKP